MAYRSIFYRCIKILTKIFCGHVEIATAFFKVMFDLLLADLMISACSENFLNLSQTQGDRRVLETHK